jgi:hypothetical protein
VLDHFLLTILYSFAVYDLKETDMKNDYLVNLIQYWFIDLLIDWLLLHYSI